MLEEKGVCSGSTAALERPMPGQVSFADLVHQVGLDLQRDFLPVRSAVSLQRKDELQNGSRNDSSRRFL